MSITGKRETGPFPWLLRPDAFAIILIGALASIIFSLRLIIASRIISCGDPDPCFYFSLSQSISEGRGFLVDYIWNHQSISTSLPAVAIDYWRPGASLLFLLTVPFGGPTLFTVGVLNNVLLFLTAVVAGVAAWDLTRDRMAAFASFAVCLCMQPFWVLIVMPDATPLYMVSVAWFLVAMASPRPRAWKDLLALGCLSIAYLTRNDAVLLALPLAAGIALRCWRTGPWYGDVVRPAILVAGFMAALAPFHILHHAVFGTWFPASTRTGFLVTSLDQFSWYGEAVTLSIWADGGIKDFILQRVSAVIAAAFRLLFRGDQLIVCLAVLGVWSVIKLRAGSPQTLLPWAIFLAACFVVYTLVLPGIGGPAVLRTATGVFPILAALAVVGAGALANPSVSKRVILGAIVIVSVALGLNDTRRTLNQFAEHRLLYSTVAETLTDWSVGRETALRIMIDRPVQFTVTTGVPSIVQPMNGIDAVLQAASDFAISHIILEERSADVSRLASIPGARVRPIGQGTGRVAIELPR